MCTVEHGGAVSDDVRQVQLVFSIPGKDEANQSDKMQELTQLILLSLSAPYAHVWKCVQGIASESRLHGVWRCVD